MRVLLLSQHIRADQNPRMDRRRANGTLSKLPGGLRYRLSVRLPDNDRVPEADARSLVLKHRVIPDWDHTTVNLRHEKQETRARMAPVRKAAYSKLRVKGPNPQCYFQQRPIFNAH
jgi:hypothetical protein